MFFREGWDIPFPIYTNWRDVIQSRGTIKGEKVPKQPKKAKRDQSESFISLMDIKYEIQIQDAMLNDEEPDITITDNSQIIQ